MANDCLVTKLKSVVNNDNLEKLGRIRFIINCSNNDNGVKFVFAEEAQVELINGTFKDTGLKTKTISANTNWTPNLNSVQADQGESAANIVVEIPKYTCYCYGRMNPYPAGDTFYNLISLTCVNYAGKYSQINFTPRYEEVGKYSIDGLQGLRVSTLTALNVAGYKLVNKEPLDITNLGNQGSTLGFFSLSLTQAEGKIVGSFDNLGKTTLSAISFPEAKSTSIDLYNFVANRRALGSQYQTGSVTLSYLSKITVKYNGTVITVPSTQTQTQTLAWTADSITLNGTPLGE